MHTLQHGFWTYFFLRKYSRVWQFVIGGMLPDFIYVIGGLYLLGSGKLPWSMQLLEMSPAAGISLLRSLTWLNTIDFAGHSFIIWLVFFAGSFIAPLKRVQAVILGWGGHILFDAVTHVEYAPYLFYPFSWLQLPIGISFWNSEYHGVEFRLVQGILTLLAASYLGYEYFKQRRK